MKEKTQPKVTSQNTKKEILEFLDEQTKKLKDLEKVAFDGKMQKDMLQKENIFSIIDTLSPESIQSLLIETTNKLEEIKKIDKAIDIKKEEYSQLYGIEAEVHTFAALIESKKEYAYRAELELKERLNKIKESYDIEIEKLKERISETEKDHKRQEEDWEYEFNRSKKHIRNDFDDKITNEKKTIVNIKNELAEKEKELNKQVSEFKAEKEIFNNELIEKTETLKNTEAEIKKRIEKSFEYRLTIEKKSLETKIQILESKTLSLEEQNKKLETNLVNTEEKLDKAYERIQLIGTANIQNANTQSITSQIKDYNNKNN